MAVVDKDHWILVDLVRDAKIVLSLSLSLLFCLLLLRQRRRSAARYLTDFGVAANEKREADGKRKVVKERKKKLSYCFSVRLALISKFSAWPTPAILEFFMISDAPPYPSLEAQNDARKKSLPNLVVFKYRVG